MYEIDHHERNRIDANRDQALFNEALEIVKGKLERKHYYECDLRIRQSIDIATEERIRQSK